MDEERRDQPIEHHNEAGVRGGSAAFAAAPPGTDYMLGWTKAVVRWSPIWVGLVVALGINLVLYVLSMAIALSTASPAETGATGGLARDVLQTAGIWSAISTIVALFVGGMLAGRLGIKQGLRNGIVQGTVVWALFLIAAMIFSMFGLGGMLSGLAGLADMKNVSAAGSTVTTPEAQRMVSGAATSMWWLFFGLVLSWLAAALGGLSGEKSARPEIDEQHRS